MEKQASTCLQVKDYNNARLCNTLPPTLVRIYLVSRFSHVVHTHLDLNSTALWVCFLCQKKRSYTVHLILII